MKYISGTVFVFFLTLATAFAEKLEVKINGKSILLPYWSAPKNAHGAVVLIRGGEQARWSELLAHTAAQLFPTGWSVVLVNCSADSSEPWAKTVPEVIQALRQQKYNRIVVVHYGEQLKQTYELFNKSQKAGIEGLILLSAYDIKNEDKKPELSMPLLDLVGQFDYDFVIQQMNSRQRMFAQNNYISMTIPGANHDYGHSIPLLSSFIQGWMLHLAEFKPVVPPVLVSYVESIEPLMPKQLAFDEETDWAIEEHEPPAEDEMQEITAP